MARQWIKCDLVEERSTCTLVEIGGGGEGLAGGGGGGGLGDGAVELDATFATDRRATVASFFVLLFEGLLTSAGGAESIIVWRCVRTRSASWVDLRTRSCTDSSSSLGSSFAVNFPTTFAYSLRGALGLFWLARRR